MDIVVNLAITIATGVFCAFATAYFSAHFAAKHVKSKADEYFGGLVNRVSVLEQRADEFSEDKNRLWKKVSVIAERLAHTRGKLGLNGSIEN